MLHHDLLPTGLPGAEHAVLTTALHEFAESLGNAVDAKDPHTRQHSDEVAEAARVLALHLGLPPALADVIHLAGHLHDVGKIGVPDTVLFKTGPLTPAERALMRRHPERGAEIVRPVLALGRCGVPECILHHHERWDGRGYPHGLRGAAIPLGARVIALADALSAMLQDRPYRRALDFDRARAEIVAQRGAQFDPAVVDAFRLAEDELRRMFRPAGRALPAPDHALNRSPSRTPNQPVASTMGPGPAWPEAAWKP
ncbi:MAG: HD-GYP domain-containing protein [Desulfovibrionaceae bacterium]